MSLLCLPVDYLITIFKNLDIESIENLKTVHSRFRDIIKRYKLDVRAAKKLTITRSTEAKEDGTLYVLWKIDVEIYEENYGRFFCKSKSLPLNIVNKTETTEQLRNALIELNITSVDALSFQETWFYIDTNALFENTGIDFSGLTTCEKNLSEVKLNFLNGEFFKNSISPKLQTLDFNQCVTSITAEEIMTIVEENFKGMRSFCYNFGRIDVSTEEFEMFKEFASNRKNTEFEVDSIAGTCKLIREREFPTLHQHIEFSYF